VKLSESDFFYQNSVVHLSLSASIRTEFLKNGLAWGSRTAIPGYLWTATIKWQVEYLLWGVWSQLFEQLWQKMRPHILQWCWKIMQINTYHPLVAEAYQLIGSKHRFWFAHCEFRMSSFRKNQDRIVESKNGFYISFLDRLIQDRFHHGSSKKQRFHSRQTFFGSFNVPWSEWSRII